RDFHVTGVQTCALPIFDLPVEFADADDVAVLLQTSGTTSAPKSAVLRHRHLASYALGTVEFGAADADEATLVAVPPYHIAAVARSEERRVGNECRAGWA